MLSDGGEAAETLKALVGLTAHHAKLLMQTALHCCTAESESGSPDRWPAVMLALREGRSPEALFPHALYAKASGPAN